MQYLAAKELRKESGYRGKMISYSKETTTTPDLTLQCLESQRLGSYHQHILPLTEQKMDCYQCL